MFGFTPPGPVLLLGIPLLAKAGSFGQRVKAAHLHAIDGDKGGGAANNSQMRGGYGGAVGTDHCAHEYRWTQDLQCFELEV